LLDPRQEQIDRSPMTELTVNIAHQETRHPNRIVLVGANNRVLWASRSRTVGKDCGPGTHHKTDLGELTVNHRKQRTPAVARSRAGLQGRQGDLQVEIVRVVGGLGVTELGNKEWLSPG